MKRLICLLCITCYLHAAQQATEKIGPVATHGMAMVFGYVSPEQYAAGADVEPFVFNPFTDRLENSGVITRLADLFSQQKVYILTNTSLFRAMIKRYPNIKLEEWRCRAISDFVYIFVRNSLLPPENVQNPYAQVADFEALEPYLGVKISDKTTISTEELRSVYYSKQPSKNLTDECNNILSCFWEGGKSKIFLTKTDYTDYYAKYTKEAHQEKGERAIVPTWAFLMLGLGKQSQSLMNPDGLACGLLIPIMRQVIDFFTAQLNVGMIIASSSYFSDINLVATLKENDIKKPLKKYPFTFVATDITAAPLLSGLGLDESRNYDTFFTTILPPPTLDALRINWQPRVENFEDVIDIVCRPYRYFVGSEERLTTPAAIPSMRLANEQFFVPARFGGNVVVISNALVKPGLENQPLYLKELINGHTKNGPNVPDIILLTISKDFTRPLVLAPRADKKLPTIIGINPGPYTYVFDEIDSQGAGISAVVDAFLRVPNLEQDRAFVIKKLHATNDIDKLITVNKPKAEKTFFELKIVHTRPGVIGGKNKNMVVVKQFDCTKNCVAKVTAQTIEPPAAKPPAQKVGPVSNPMEKPTNPNYSNVAAAEGSRDEKVELRWSAIGIGSGPDAIDAIISTIRSKQISPTLGLFAE